MLDAVHRPLNRRAVPGVPNRHFDTKSARSLHPQGLGTRQPTHAATALEDAHPDRSAKEAPSNHKDARLPTAPFPHIAASIISFETVQSSADAAPRTPADGAPEERFLPEAMRDQLIEAEHHARYRFAAAVVRGKRALDAGCGVGWGSQILIDHGAASVDGVDLDEPAVRESRVRCPMGTFVRGDLTDLPYANQCFDVVICFEAIEHVHDPLRGLDEFRRVLAPDGIVLVSSPNPGVYPAGNPFHIHEFKPQDLLIAMTQRFQYANLWLQHNLIASAVHQDGVAPPDPPGSGHRVAVLTDLRSARDVYSLVVASARPLPDIPPMVTLVSARQLDDLASAAEAIMAERSAYAADHARIVDERSRLVSEHAGAFAECERLSGEVAQLEGDARRRAGELARARSERDRAWLRLLESEQEFVRSQTVDSVPQEGP
jgi:2-polyprenyl-3-methyl-5-hydroxy-6-metoxy-1,4-benzoquinol methylase